MAGLWYRAGTVTVTTGSAKVTGFGSVWKSGANKPDKGHTFWGPDGKHYELDYVESDTVLYLVKPYVGPTASGQSYEIDTTRTSTIPALSREVSALLAYAQGQYDGWQSVLTGSGDVLLTAPDGQQVTVPSLSNMLSKSGNLSGLGDYDVAMGNLGLTPTAIQLVKAANVSKMLSILGAIASTDIVTPANGAKLSSLFNKIPRFGGVPEALLEVGAIIDMHSTASGETDYTVRLNALNDDTLDVRANGKEVRIGVHGSVGADGIISGAELVATGLAGLGGRVSAGAGDGASADVCNLQIKSWFGIGFSPTIDGQPVAIGKNGVWIDVRTGSLYARYLESLGDVRAVGQFISGSGYTVNNGGRFRRIGGSDHSSMGIDVPNGNMFMSASTGRNSIIGNNFTIGDGDQLSKTNQAAQSGILQIGHDGMKYSFSLPGEASLWAHQVNVETMPKYLISAGNPQSWKIGTLPADDHGGNRAMFAVRGAFGSWTGKKEYFSVVFSVREGVAGSTLFSKAQVPIALYQKADNSFEVWVELAGCSCMSFRVEAVDGQAYESADPQTGTPVGIKVWDAAQYVGRTLTDRDYVDSRTSSDIKLKSNIKSIDSAIDKVSCLAGYTFDKVNWPFENIEKKAGVIAQEVEKVLPEAIGWAGDEETGIKTVDPLALCGLLIEAVKELKSKVDDLEAIVAANGHTVSDGVTSEQLLPE